VDIVKDSLDASGKFHMRMNHVFKRKNKLVCESILVQTFARIVNVIQGLEKLSKLRTFVTKLAQQHISVKRFSDFSLAHAKDLKITRSRCLGGNILRINV
jgi:hypothetical protein